MDKSHLSLQLNATAPLDVVQQFHKNGHRFRQYILCLCDLQHLNRTVFLMRFNLFIYVFF